MRKQYFDRLIGMEYIIKGLAKFSNRIILNATICTYTSTSIDRTFSRTYIRHNFRMSFPEIHFRISENTKIEEKIDINKQLLLKNEIDTNISSTTASLLCL